MDVFYFWNNGCTSDPIPCDRLLVVYVKALVAYQIRHPVVDCWLSMWRHWLAIRGIEMKWSSTWLVIWTDQPHILIAITKFGSQVCFLWSIQNMLDFPGESLSVSDVLQTRLVCSSCSSLQVHIWLTNFGAFMKPSLNKKKLSMKV